MENKKLKEDLVMRLDKLQKLQQERQRELDRLEGWKSQLLERLESEFKLSSLEAAKTKLASLQKDLDRRHVRIERLVTELEGTIDG